MKKFLTYLVIAMMGIIVAPLVIISILLMVGGVVGVITGFIAVLSLTIAWLAPFIICAGLAVIIFVVISDLLDF